MSTPQQSSMPNSSWPVWTQSPEANADLKWSVSVGLALALIFHLLLIWAIVQGIFVMEGTPQERQVAEVIELEVVAEEEAQVEQRFVEPNPKLAPEVPQETNNFAAQDQVSAQEEPGEDDSADPRIEGEFEDSQKIVEGELIEEPDPQWEEGQPLPKSSPQTPNIAEMAQQAQSEAVEPVQASAPAAVLLPAEVLEDGRDTIVKIVDELPEEIIPSEVEEPMEEIAEEEPVEEESQDEETVSIVVEEVPVAVLVQPGQPAPKPRKVVSYRVPQGPLLKNPRSTRKVGTLAIDAKFSEFGAYIQRMNEAISAEWNLMAQNFRLGTADFGTKVVIRFQLNRMGELEALEIVFSSASKSATLLVQDSISSRAPFGLWTEDMVRVLGERQVIQATFYYR